MARKARGLRVRLGTIRVLPATATILAAHQLSSRLTSLGDVLDELAALRLDRDAALQAAHDATHQAEVDRRAAVALAADWERRFRDLEDRRRQEMLDAGQVAAPRSRRRRAGKARAVVPQVVLSQEPDAVQYLVRACRDPDVLGKVIAGLQGGFRGPSVLAALRVAPASHILSLLRVDDGA